MAETVQKKFRLLIAQAEALEAEAVARGCSQTDVVRDLIDRMDGANRGERDVDEGGAQSSAIDALAAQLAVKDRQIAVKDEQIKSLSEALINAQESAKAAQALHAVDTVPMAIRGGGQDQARKGRWQRLLDAWHG